MNTVMKMLSISECQVLMQDIALELTRLDRRLGKIHYSHSALTNSPLEAKLPIRIFDLRQKHLQPAAVQLLELAQEAAQERLQSAASALQGELS